MLQFHIHIQARAHACVNWIMMERWVSYCGHSQKHLKVSVLKVPFPVDGWFGASKCPVLKPAVLWSPAATIRDVPIMQDVQSFCQLVFSLEKISGVLKSGCLVPHCVTSKSVPFPDLHTAPTHSHLMKGLPWRSWGPSRVCDSQG